MTLKNMNFALFRHLGVISYIFNVHRLHTSFLETKPARQSLLFNL